MITCDFPEGWENEYGTYIFVRHEEMDDFIEACVAHGDTPYEELKQWAQEYAAQQAGVFCYRSAGMIHAKKLWEDEDEDYVNFADICCQEKPLTDFLSLI